jgi:4-hydroxy-4-methyl-2-oxoglutarate aldolase
VSAGGGGPTGDRDRSGVLTGLGSATLGECGALAMPPKIRPVWSGATVAAPAYPVRCTPGDNLAIHVAVARAPAGSVLVVDVGDVTERGYWGEVLTTGAMARGLRGLVIDGGVRDVAALEALGFPVFSRTVALRGAAKVARGTVGSAVVVAGVPVDPGDWVVGDVDGVVVVPGDRLAEVVAAGRARSAAEDGYFTALRAGATTVELLGLDASLVEDGGPID